MVDSVVSPICGCFSDEVKHYGLMLSAPEFTISKYGDRSPKTCFTITAPSEDVITYKPSLPLAITEYKFEASPYKIYDPKIIFSDTSRYAGLKLISKKTYKHIGFAGLINTGKVKVYLMKNRSVGSMVPVGNSIVQIKQNNNLNTGHVKDVEINQFYSDVSSIIPAEYDFLGPQIIVSSEENSEFLTETGISSDQDSSKNNVCFLVINVPFTARISVSSWSEDIYNYYEG